jgi:hypothetical protein
MAMKARRALLLTGSLWEVVRFSFLIMLTAVMLRQITGAGGWVVPWLLMGGTGNLLVAVGGFMLFLFPDRYAGLVGLLRLGKGMGVFSFMLLLASGAFRVAIGVDLTIAGKAAVPPGALLFAVFVLDLLFLGVLLTWRPPSTDAPDAPDAPADLPAYPKGGLPW